MPIVEVMLDRCFDETLEEVAENLASEIVTDLMSGIEASRDDCQVVFLPGVRALVGFPIHVTVRYRAYEHRTRDRVEATLDAIGQRLRARFTADVRLRGFPADNSTLAAVNLHVDN